MATFRRNKAESKDVCRLSCGRNAMNIYREERTSRFAIAMGLLSMTGNIFV